MRRGRKSTPNAPAGLIGLRLRRLGPVVLLLVLTGCVPETTPAFDNDPLVGGRRLPRNGEAPTGAFAAQRTPAAPFQLAPASGPTSPAALAVGGPPAADASSLRIGQPPAYSGSLSGQSTAPQDGDPWRGATPSPGATLKQPEPLNDPRGRPIAEIVAPTVGSGVTPPAAAAGPDAYDQLQDMLARRGVLFQSLQGPDERGLWRFTCGVPIRGQPGTNHVIELSAPGDHGLAAVRAVIDQIDREQQQR